ncbi:MAG: hypothetical protein HN644_08965 [Rhodospirillales bacterium]|jgi:hypothetical protein|nr:hypothetical protein [Rhodospirillales bacterium]MBT4039404.1 hypothetical protein [Rhodospirillales bacterium]MBT4627166.1 hypothetical protein [Rhodospirillales bacterium]MBT5352462.1 hypothetical protein [Rhodospirillales bacterium]MBT5519550.1 hypothetical protein [Rhodospirillales bacterium]
MDLEVILPADAEALTPILITSPNNCAGGAMLQRAFCTGENSIGFGDNLFDEIMSLVDWSFSLVERHQNQKDWEAEAITKALDRAPAPWMPELALPLDVYTASLMSVIYNLPFTLQSYASDLGREVWSISRAGIASSRMNDLGTVLPNSKMIFVYRNPLDVVQDFLRDSPDANVRDICDTWNTVMHDYLTYASDRLLKLRYEDATDDVDKFLTSLQDFTGAKGIDPAVVAVESESELGSDYTIGDDLKALVQRQCEDMLAVYYPELIA